MRKQLLLHIQLCICVHIRANAAIKLYIMDSLILTPLRLALYTMYQLEIIYRWTVGYLAVSQTLQYYYYWYSLELMCWHLMLAIAHAILVFWRTTICSSVNRIVLIHMKYMDGSAVSAELVQKWRDGQKLLAIAGLMRTALSYRFVTKICWTLCWHHLYLAIVIWCLDELIQGKQLWLFSCTVIIWK